MCPNLMHKPITARGRGFRKRAKRESFTMLKRYCFFLRRYELDENGKEVFDFQFEHDKAWSAFQRENEKREQQQQKWWDQNPQW